MNEVHKQRKWLHAKVALCEIGSARNWSCESGSVLNWTYDSFNRMRKWLRAKVGLFEIGSIIREMNEI